ncbi:MAG TPA: amino acid adenylation domain-containing protein, partial [Longimicrobium sp.]
MTELGDAGGLGIQERYPLTSLQHGMLLRALLAPGAGVNVQQVVCRFREPPDAERLERAWRRVVARHDILRTRFRWMDVPEPVQEVLPQVRLEIARRECAGLAPADREAAVEGYLAEDRARGFDLAEAPAMRLALFPGAADEHVLVWSFHHILLDAWSITRVLDEAFTLYDADAEAALPIPRPFGDHIRWLRERDGAADEAYWTGILGGLEAPAPVRPIRSAPRDPRGEPHFGARELRLSPAADAALRALKRDRGVFVNTVVQGAWALLLGRYTGRTEAVFGTVRHGRATGLEGAEGMVGMLINTVPLRVPLPPEARVADWLEEVAARNAALGAHQHAALPDLQRWSGLPQGAPLFDTIVSYQPLPFEAAFRGTEGRSVSMREHPGYPLVLGVDAEAPLRASIQYDADLFDAAAVDRMLGHFARLLEEMAADPERPLGALDLLGETERALVLEEWNRTAAEHPADRCIHELFEEQAARTPGAVALVHGGERLTYADLAARVDRLALRLDALGVGLETRVGICLERGPEMIVAVLATLAAGGAYVPIDPVYPAERIAYLLEDSGVPVVLTQAALAGRFADFGGTVALVDGADTHAGTGGRSGPRARTASARSLAYVIYTSGSSGRPKGVGVEHGSLANYARVAREYFGITPADRVLQFASLSFDTSAEEIHCTLLGGATLVLRTEEMLGSAARFFERCEEWGITVLGLPTAYWHELVGAMDRGEASLPACVRLVVIGGERMLPEAVAQWRRTVGDAAGLVNAYGPTEATVSATLGHVGEGALSIGGPVGNVRVYVLEPSGAPAPVGVPGELYVGGAGVARGYLGRPGLTAERFVPDPFGGAPGARLYRTGDRARWLPEGTLEYGGRLDGQVKVRGFRIEPEEIEAVLCGHGAVDGCAVVAREDRSGDRRLVAYVVGGADPAELRGYLRRNLPEYMVPSAFVSLDQLPVTPNGKVDRRALPAPDLASAEERYVAPRAPVEEVLAGIWAEVLRVERVGVEDRFFELGGHSLLATRVVSRMRELLGVELPLRALFEHPTVAELAVRVEEMRRADLPALPAVVPADRAGALPLSFAQERLWFLDRLEPGSTTYNLPVAWRLGGMLDRAALERALGEIVRRHESLRTVFAEVDGSPVQVVVPFGGFALPVEDLSGLSEVDREAAVGRRAGEEAGRAFDLSAGPLFRAALLRVDEEDHVLLLSMHHVVSDEWSMGVLFRELSALYAAYLAGGESPLPELAVQYADYAVWQREQLAGEVLDRQLSYWTERLAGAPELLELPTDRPRPPARTYQGATVPVSFAPELLERLQTLGRSEGATLYMTLLGAFQVLLSKYSGSEDIVVGSPIAGRTRREVEELIGFFVNTLVLRTDLSGDPSFRDVLRRVREVTLGAYEHQEVPFEKLVAELRPERSLSHAPIFQVMFTLQNAEGEGGALPGLSVRGAGADLEGAKFDLSLSLAATASGLRGTLTYATDLFEPDTPLRMVGHLERLLEQVAAEADARLSRLDLLGEAERALVLEEWNRTAAEVPADRCIHELFAAQAARTPRAPALVHAGEVLDYAGLERAANRLANHLRRLGVGPETRVGICLERGPELVVAMLAILKAGGAYVPLDPAYPRERLAYMQEDAAITLVITDSALADRLPENVAGLLLLDADRATIDAGPDVAPESGVGLENLSHVIFTSGSTGRPKGVMIRHSSTVVLLHWLRETVTDEERSSVLFSTSINFDVSVAEVFGTLCWGGKLVIAENALELATLGEDVVYASMVPSAAAELLRSGGIPACVKTLNLGGEALPNALAQGLYGLGTVEKVGNLYGPTEDTTYSTYYVVPRGADQVLIGTPVANTQAYVLDRHLQPVPIGVVGELYLAGDGLSRGYANRPAMTAERFVPCPFGAPGARMYRVMDRVRRRPDGELEYLGRTDFQVKVRGFRIEPGEIEAVLRQAPGVTDCAVVAREDETGDRRLVAYIVGEAEAEALRAHVRRSLPEYMVPSAFVPLEALPLTPNGKLDRKALPAPDLASAEETYVAPRTPVEEVLAGIWAEVLGRERVGVEEGFFELGGHSLLATRVVSRMRELLGVELPLRVLFERPTVAQLAVRVEEMRRADLPALPAVVPADRTGALPLSFAQERLWFIDRLEPGSAVYNIPMAWRLGGALDGAALERSLSEIVRRHESLRTVFAEVDGSPVQVIVPFGGFSLPVEDLSSEADREAAVRRRVGEEARRAFD